MIVAGRGPKGSKAGSVYPVQKGTLNSNLWVSVAKLMGLGKGIVRGSTGVVSDMWT
ncbi:MAG: hypothetical protein Ct9H300mP7_0310 [Verrucomicrobiota bacterium]|nr:MAG: hypothetical protein Ct9H300mP7_0310 [Verrucomicrobiota bacterium]